MNLMILWLIDKNDLKGETWEKEWFSEGQLKLDLWSPIHREKTLAMQFNWYTYTKNFKAEQKKELHLLIDVNVISLFIFSYGQYLNSVHRPWMAK